MLTSAKMVTWRPFKKRNHTTCEHGGASRACQWRGERSAQQQRARLERRSAARALLKQDSNSEPHTHPVCSEAAVQRASTGTRHMHGRMGGGCIWCLQTGDVLWPSSTQTHHCLYYPTACHDSGTHLLVS